MGIAQGVGAQGHEVGGVGIVGGGEEEDGVGVVAAGPVVEAVTMTRGGIEQDAVAAHGIGAAAAHGALGGVGRYQLHHRLLLVGHDGIDVEEGAVQLVEGGIALLPLLSEGQVADGEVAVVVARPSPVHMEEVVIGAVAVHHKGVAARGAAAGIDDRVSGLQLAAHQGVPFGVAIALLEAGIAPGVIAEVVLQGLLGREAFQHTARMLVGAAGRRRVVHIGRHTHLVAELRNGIFLDLRAGGTQHIGHIVPVVGRGVEVHGERLVAPLVGVAAASLRGVSPETHHLSRGGSHAAGHRLGMVDAVVGAAQVVG